MLLVTVHCQRDSAKISSDLESQTIQNDSIQVRNDELSEREVLNPNPNPNPNRKDVLVVIYLDQDVICYVGMVLTMCSS
jgi:hypothetical protein